MQENIDFFEPDELAPEYPELQTLAQSLLSEGGVEGLPSVENGEWTPRPAVTLDLAELLGGGTGEIVLSSDAPLALTSPSQVTDAGLVDHHVTADGEDVSGLAYLSFESGVTIYYSATADLALDTIIS